jgi:putative ABC transport system ATP-binding protein
VAGAFLSVPTLVRSQYYFHHPDLMNDSPAVAIIACSKTYRHLGRPVEALREVSLTVPAGEFLALVGASGSGKSTLLNIVGGIDRATSGLVTVHGTNITTLSDAGLTLLRRSTIGIVFQFFNLMPTMSVLENVQLPLLLAGSADAAAANRATRLLEEVGLAQRLDHHPHELSGGEMQRVAIARALVNDPPVILADEPTGNLDSVNAGHVLVLLRQLAERYGKTLIIATHSADVASRADRTVTLKDGTITRA